jgi:alkyl hydroperoxide reductase subunit AhpF
MMKKSLLILLAIQSVIILASCTSYDQRVEITDVKKPQVLVLKKKADQKDIVSMKIHCYGRLEGEAKLIIAHTGATYRSTEIKGNVNYKLSGDWYADSMEVSYQPQNVTSGHLTIEYTFSDI